jgi:hypothetical protein
MELARQWDLCSPPKICINRISHLRDAPQNTITISGKRARDATPLNTPGTNISALCERRHERFYSANKSPAADTFAANIKIKSPFHLRRKRASTRTTKAQFRRAAFGLSQNCLLPFFPHRPSLLTSRLVL